MSYEPNSVIALFSCQLKPAPSLAPTRSTGSAGVAKRLYGSCGELSISAGPSTAYGSKEVGASPAVGQRSFTSSETARPWGSSVGRMASSLAGDPGADDGSASGAHGERDTP